MHTVLDHLKAIVTSPRDRVTRAKEAAETIRAARNFHWVGLYDVTPTAITAIAWTGSTAPTYLTLPRTGGLNGVAVAAGAPIIVQDVRKNPHYLTTFGATLAEAIFPVCSGAEVVGTIDVESDRTNAFTPDDECFLQECAVALAPLWAGRGRAV